MSKRLLGTTVTLEARANLVADSSSRLSSSITEQAEATQETVSSIEEIRAMVEQTAEHTKNSQEKVHNAVNTANQGQSTVNTLSDVMNEIVSGNERLQKQIETTNHELGQIVSVIRDIDTKTRVINDIVFQTKLLSFNASVEAARAGEHGKGFAVVAEEVGNLAQMSGTAAKEISSMLADNITQVEKMINNTRESVGRLIQENKNIIDRGSKKAVHCGEAFGQMKTEVDGIQSLISQITNATQEQARGIQEISKAIAQIDSGLSKNTKASSEVSAVSADLNHQNVELTNAAHTLAWSILGETAKQRLDAESE